MQVVPYTEKYLAETIALFIKVYSDHHGTWLPQKAEEYLQRIIKQGTGYCFVAVQQEMYMGSIFSYLSPYYDRDLVFIDILQVASKFRKQGVARALMRTVIDKATNNQIPIINLWADGGKDFPKSWYESLGFKRNGWVEYQMSLEENKATVSSNAPS